MKRINDKTIKKYFPYDFLAHRLYFRAYGYIYPESEDWGFIVDPYPEDHWSWERVAEAKKIGVACMKTNVQKAISEDRRRRVIRFKNGSFIVLNPGDEVIEGSTTFGTNPFYNYCGDLK